MQQHISISWTTNTYLKKSYPTYNIQIHSHLDATVTLTLTHPHRIALHYHPQSTTTSCSPARPYLIPTHRSPPTPRYLPRSSSHVPLALFRFDCPPPCLTLGLTLPWTRFFYSFFSLSPYIYIFRVFGFFRLSNVNTFFLFFTPPPSPQPFLVGLCHFLSRFLFPVRCIYNYLKEEDS